jgi:hypothetical protein
MCLCDGGAVAFAEGIEVDKRVAMFLRGGGLPQY